MLPYTNKPALDENFSKFNLITWLEKQIMLIPSLTTEQIYSFSRKLFPVEANPNPYVDLFRSMLKYIGVKSNADVTYETLASEIVIIASAINDQLSKTIQIFLVKEMVKAKINYLLRTQNEKKPTTVNVLNTFQVRTKGNEKITKSLLDRGFESYHKPANTQEIVDRYIKQRNEVKNLSSVRNNKKLCTVCEKQIIENNSLDSQFRCEDCGNFFHKRCQYRKNNCMFCQLKNLNPLKKVKKQLFIGFMRKGIKKHQIQFKVQEEDLVIKYDRGTNGVKKSYPLVQVRSLRLKGYYDQVANYFNIFPDACTVMVNGKLIKQFTPLHKQSSLKYRKDESMSIKNFLKQGNNKLMVTERYLKKDVKYDERIQNQNHLIGVYIYEQVRIPRQPSMIQQFLMKDPVSSKILNVKGVGTENQDFMKETQTLSFSQSEVMLKESLLLGNEQGEQISCDTLKVPLTCSYTLTLMENPGRTIFCRHFSCFDIRRFFLANSSAHIPKWQCPICKVPAYRFKIDCILKSIIQIIRKIQVLPNGKNPEQSAAVQVLFKSDYSFKICNKQGSFFKNSKETISCIYDLPIEGKFIRFRDDSQELWKEDERNHKRVKPNFEQEANDKQLDEGKEEKDLERSRAKEKLQQKIKQKFKVQTSQASIERKGQCVQDHSKGKQKEHNVEKKFFVPVGCQVVDLSD